VKRVLAVLVTVVWIGVLLVACGGKATSTNGLSNADAAPSQAKVRIGAEAILPPFETINTTTKELSGFDIDLMKAIATRAGLNIVLVNVGKDQLLSGVLNCGYDAGISAISMTDELRQQLVFSDPYLSVAQALVVQKGNITITGPDQLPGMTLGTQRGSSVANEAQNIPGAQLAIYPSFDLAFQDLLNGNIDAVLAGGPRATSYVSVPSNRLKIVGGEFGTENYGIAVCKQNQDLLTKINEGLAAVTADSTLDTLTRKWLNR
jgi:polar amino acid transport system substrate-binding protein